MDGESPPQPAQLYTPKQLAERLSVPIGTVYGWRSKGEGPPSMKIGKYVRYRESDVETWLDSRKSEPQSEKSVMVIWES